MKSSFRIDRRSESEKDFQREEGIVISYNIDAYTSIRGRKFYIRKVVRTIDKISSFNQLLSVLSYYQNCILDFNKTEFTDSEWKVIHERYNKS